MNVVSPLPKQKEGGLPLRTISLGIGVGSIVLIIVTVLGLRLGVVSDSRMETVAPRAGMPAPDFTLQTSSGEMFQLSEIQGQPVWITFWTTWCPPCRVEMPDLQEAYQKAPPGRYEYIAVNFGEDIASVRRFLDEVGYSLPVAVDPTSQVSIDYGVLNLPTHFFIDENGIVREVYAGALSQHQIERRVSELW